MKKGLAFLFLCLICACSLENPVESTGSYTEYEFAYWILEKQYYFDDLPAKDDYSTPAELYAAVPDKYTRYVPPVKADEDNQQMTTSINNGTIGIELESYTSNEFPLAVSRVYPGSPAEREGLPRHANLLALNGESLKGDVNGAIFYSAMPKKDTAVITYALESDTATLHIPRETVYAPTVFLDTLLTGNPIIAIKKFASSTYNRELGTVGELDSVVTLLQDTKKTVVLDLRDNPGGQVSQCNEAADMFIGKGISYKMHDNVLLANGSSKKIWRNYLSTDGGKGENWNILLVANNHSASCAEIFIMALKRENTRVRFAGTSTFGKGIGQISRKTKDGALVYVTSMMIYNSEKESYHGKGIEPDIPCPKANLNCIYNALAEHSGRSPSAQKFGISNAAEGNVIADPSDNFMGGALIQSEELR